MVLSFLTNISFLYSYHNKYKKMWCLWTFTISDVSIIIVINITLFSSYYIIRVHNRQIFMRTEISKILNKLV